MDKTKLQIASVQLTNGGMKGITVEYLLPSVKGNVQFFDIYKSKRKAPIHSELEDTFSWLKSHLLDICGYTLEKEEREYHMGVLSMTGIKYGEKGIILYGDLLVLGGTRVLKLETPLITDEVEYPDFEKLKHIAEGIYAETKEYMDGKKVMSDAQIIARFNAKNQEFDAVGLANMSKEEQREIATKILEEQGCMVFHNDEFEVSEAPTQIPDGSQNIKPEKIKKDKALKIEVVKEIDELTAVAPADVFAEEEINVPALPKDDLSIEASRKPEVKLEAVVMSDSPITLVEDEDFELPIKIKKPIKESTAKKKTA